MCLAPVLASLQFKRDGQVLHPLVILHGNLHRGVNITLQAVGWGPNVLFYIEKPAHAQIDSLAVAVLRFCLGL